MTPREPAAARSAPNRVPSGWVAIRRLDRIPRLPAPRAPRSASAEPV
jgi:hypothetical protein